MSSALLKLPIGNSLSIELRKRERAGVLFLAAFFTVVVACVAQPQADQGSISGTVVDASGAMVSHAKVVLMQPGLVQTGMVQPGLAQPGLAQPEAPPRRETVSDSSGNFVFRNVPDGPFQLTASAPGFADSHASGVVQASQNFVIPSFTLTVARADVDVEVTIPQEQVAQEQLHVEEQQRLFRIIPNYYMTFEAHPAPLTPRMKFQLAWKTTTDPVSFLITGAVAGFEQAGDTYGGFGQGAQGYAKRYGTAYADFVSGTFIGGAILPSVFKQDPRYFWKGTGSTKSRVLYAIAFSVLCKGDNGRWQVNYSGILGGLAAGGISNLYYPAQDRNGAALTFENLAIGTGFSAAGNIVQEFFFKKMSSHVPDNGSSKN